MKKVLLSVFALAAFIGTVTPAHARTRHCYYKHHHRHCYYR